MYVAYFFKVNCVLEKKKKLISQFADAGHQAHAREQLADTQTFQFTHLIGKFSLIYTSLLQYKKVFYCVTEKLYIEM